MADHHPLRRWKRFLAAFGAIDAAIEAAGPGASRDEFRRARCGVVERLCDTSEEGERDELCRDLDRAMVQSLLTLQAVPVAPATLARTELVPAVRALRRHECERVRALASDIVKRTPPGATGDAPSEHDALHSPLAANAKAGNNKEMTALPVGTGRSERVESITNTSQAVTASAGSNVNDSPTRKVLGPAASKKTALAVATTARSVRVESTSKVSVTTSSSRITDSSGSGGRDMSCFLDDRIEASKRRLREGYREEADAKRQRKIQLIKAPETARQRERKQHPVMRERSRVGYASSVTARRCLRAP
ncbi:hypothetical protein C2845_PM07G26380 [Panicum miliaceum]|uniref:TFIIS N-terminal domain-containing protein n=1 Tax=Panicum miliaceum TaxID=4540 RepID=A0A3L6SNT1_PANMI|nr:hypothetical protein C2845_PM07G26380 [Panicum miliaceum]